MTPLQAPAPRNACIDALPSLRSLVLQPGLRAVFDAYAASLDPEACDRPEILVRDALAQDSWHAAEFVVRGLAHAGRSDEARRVLEDVMAPEDPLAAARPRAFMQATAGGDPVKVLEWLVEAVRASPRGEHLDDLADFAARTCADVAAFTGSEEAAKLALEAATFVPKSRGQEDLMGAVVRRLALRDEVHPTELADLAAGELHRVKEASEHAFTTMQVGLAYGGLGRREDALRLLDGAQKRIKRMQDGRKEPMQAMLLRARAQAGDLEGALGLLEAVEGAHAESSKAMGRIAETMGILPVDGQVPQHLVEAARSMYGGAMVAMSGILLNVTVAGNIEAPEGARFRESALRLQESTAAPHAALKGALEIAEATEDAATAKEALARARGILQHPAMEPAREQLVHSLARVAHNFQQASLLEEAAGVVRVLSTSRSEKSLVVLSLLELLASLAEDRRTGLTCWYG